jgi:hypothetical protein
MPNIRLRAESLNGMSFSRFADDSFAIEEWKMRMLTWNVTPETPTVNSN